MYRILAVCLFSMSTAAAGDNIRTDANLDFLQPEGEKVTRIQVEIAATSRERARGLMNRLLPDDASGLLFVFPDSASRSFWMRNTPGSLDMFFADAEGKIIHIAQETTPMSDKIYRSQGAAKYVLETRGGFAARHGITPGMRFEYYPAPFRSNAQFPDRDSDARQ